MIDGKIYSAVSSVGSRQTCYICGANPRDMNHPSVLSLSQKPAEKEMLSLGLSPWIRFLECILHIAYRLDIKTWQVRGNVNKEKLKKKRRPIYRIGLKEN